MDRIDRPPPRKKPPRRVLIFPGAEMSVIKIGFFRQTTCLPGCLSSHLCLRTARRQYSSGVCTFPGKRHPIPMIAIRVGLEKIRIGRGSDRKRLIARASFADETGAAPVPLTLAPHLRP